MDIFNNREISIALWSCALLVFCLCYGSIRSGFVDVCKSFFKPVMAITILVAGTYVALLVFSLSKLGVWHEDDLKNTLLWFVFGALISVFQINSVSEDRAYFRKALVADVKLIAVLEFILSLHTFSLVGELILVPAIAILTMLHVLTKDKQEYVSVEKFLGSVLAVAGILLLVRAFYRIGSDIQNFASMGTVSDFSIPVLLSLLFLPFLYGLAVYIAYERFCLTLNIRLKDPSLHRYAKFSAFWSLSYDIEAFKRWQRNLVVKLPESKPDIRRSIAEVKHLKRLEVNPPRIILEKGWSPNRARTFLHEDGFETSDYHRVIDDDEWWSSSNNVDIGDVIFPNNIAYYISGSEKAASALILVMNINDQDSATRAKARFVELSYRLFKMALHEQMPDELCKRLNDEEVGTCAVLSKSITIYRNDWPNRAGHTLKFIIHNQDIDPEL